MVRRFNRFLLIFIPSALLFAQSETATLRGTITDTSGAGVPNVQLVLFESGKELSVREVYWGLVPDMTGTFMLSQIVGADVAKELVFTARIFSGREAKELGIATRLSDNPRDDAMALAREIAALLGSWLSSSEANTRSDLAFAV